MRTRAESNADEMITRKIDNKDPLGFGVDRAEVGGVNKVNDESEAFKGYALKECAVPGLVTGSTRVGMVHDVNIP